MDTEITPGSEEQTTDTEAVSTETEQVEITNQE